MSFPVINAGDTFLLNCNYVDSNGTPVNLTSSGIVVAPIITQPDGLGTIPATQITVTLADQNAFPGRFTVASDTALWPQMTDQWTLFFRYTDAAGNKTSSTPILFEVTPSSAGPTLPSCSVPIFCEFLP